MQVIPRYQASTLAERDCRSNGIVILDVIGSPVLSQAE